MKFIEIEFDKEYGPISQTDPAKLDDCKKLLEQRRDEMDKIFNLEEPDPKYLGLHTDKNGSLEIKAHWFVGFRWLEEGKSYIKVKPKISIDHLSMYLRCLEDEETSRHLDNTFGFDTDEEFIPLDDKEFDISPMLIATFLKKVYDISKRSLKRNYVPHSENLSGKVKGKISVSKNIKRNLSMSQPHKVFCNYEIFSIDCLENRILRAAVEKAKRYMCYRNMRNDNLAHWIRYSTMALENVALTEIADRDFQKIHYSSFYKEYKEAHRLARLIFKRLGFALDQNIGNYINSTPPFWINMNELFERYCEVLLRQNCNLGDALIAGYGLEDGNNFDTCFGKIRPDFLLKDRGMVLDAKYKDWYKHSWDKGDIAQLCMYARHSEIRADKKRGLGLDINKEKEPTIVFLYPITENESVGKDFDFMKRFENYRVESCKSFFKDIYKVAVPLPVKIL